VLSGGPGSARLCRAGVEPPDQLALQRDQAVLLVGHAHDPAEVALGMDPTQGVLEDVELYPAHLRTRKSSGDMMRKLSVTLSQSVLHRLGTSRRRKPSTASQKPL
jgi:hypothetical protein